MRGKGKTGSDGFIGPGITPAYAGKSRASDSGGNAGKDHPRLCGEKCDNAPFLSTFLGSPPPMRGKGYSIKPEQWG